jgi:hypothetical protein
MVSLKPITTITMATGTPLLRLARAADKLQLRSLARLMRLVQAAGLFGEDPSSFPRG